ncbi:MAG TPA: neuraminidase-like domain-containing protein [Methylomirabilota bacterium]|nr:neuraminidase-like domain-containing protein [Methylomirabilota bacterium]
MVGTCMEERRDDEGGLSRSSLLHIVARTNGHPQVHYHRTWDGENGGMGHFTSWKKIDLNIDGEWVFPIVRDGRLTLYWIRHEKDMESLKDTVGLTSAQPFPLQPHFPMFQDQYRLSWSTLYRGKWTPKKTAEKLITRPFLPFSEAKFAVRVVGDRVRISGLTVLQLDIAKSL